MAEIAGQKRTGSPMGERACFEGAVEGLRMARDCLRGLALLRSDQRWLLPVRLLDQLVDRITRLRDRGGRPLLVLPPRH